MELEELKTSWNILNERLNQNEILNKRIIKEMITSRILTAQQRLLWKNILGYTIYLTCLLLTCFSHALFGTPLLVVYSVSCLLLLGAILGLPAFISLLKFDIHRPLKDSFARILFYQKSLRICYPIIVCLCLFLILFIFFYFRDFKADKQTFIFIFIFLLGSVGSVIEFRWDNSKLKAIKQGLEELKEFEKEPDSE